jgi:hypothetical protein
MVDCMVKIDVTNMSSQSTIRSGAYSIKVPFASLSRTMQFIHRSGGKVVEVTKLSATDALGDLPQVVTPVHTPTANSEPRAASTTVAKSTANSEPRSASTTVAKSEQKSTPDRSSKRGGKHNKK